MTTLPLLPEIAALIGDIPLRHVDLAHLPKLRANPLAPAPVLSNAVERTDHVIPGRPDVVVRVHRCRGGAEPAPCVYSIHGGGYVMGSYESDDLKFDRWCPRFGIVGVSVEYRLAPETPYPGPLDDCYVGLKWVFDNASQLGIDATRIGITGVSAGGGLAAALALLAWDRREVPIRFQLLECPMIDDRQLTPSSQIDDLAVWRRESNTFGWQSYLGDLYGRDEVPPYAAAARATDLTGLPPTYVCVGGVDGFRDENIDYAMRLSQAGVPTELHVYPGAPHGVQLFAGTAVAKQYGRDINDWLGRQLAAP